jgi:hypothetical protein
MSISALSYTQLSGKTEKEKEKKIIRKPSNSP